MKTPIRLAAIAIATLGALCPGASAYEHLHIDAGAESQEAGSKLIFDSIEMYLADSGYVFDLSLRTSSDFQAGYYVMSDLTFTALPATAYYGGPFATSAAPNSNLHLQIVSVSGPTGGEFGFWEWTDWNSATPTISLTTGASELVAGEGLFQFHITEAAPNDPFGHIHDRAFSATQPGNYNVTFRIVDTSQHHAPSDLYELRFSAVPEPGVIAMVVLGFLFILGRWVVVASRCSD